MAIINLRRYYPHYPKDKFIDVSDEVAAALEEGRLIEGRQNHKRTYYHVYSIDQSPAIENHAMFLVLSPEELMIRAEDEAAADLMLERLADAMLLLSPIQARRLHARYALKRKFREIAADEGVSGSCAADSVNSAVRRLQKFFQKNGWIPIIHQFLLKRSFENGHESVGTPPKNSGGAVPAAARYLCESGA